MNVDGKALAPAAHLTKEIVVKLLGAPVKATGTANRRSNAPRVNRFAGENISITRQSDFRTRRTRNNESRAT